MAAHFQSDGLPRFWSNPAPSAPFLATLGLCLARKMGDAIKALTGRAIIISLNAWCCFFFSTTDKEDALVLLLKGQLFFILLQIRENYLDRCAFDTRLTFSFLIRRKKGDRWLRLGDVARHEVIVVRCACGRSVSIRRASCSGRHASGRQSRAD